MSMNIPRTVSCINSGTILTKDPPYTDMIRTAGALAYNVLPMLIAPFLGEEMEPLELPSIK